MRVRMLYHPCWLALFCLLGYINGSGRVEASTAKEDWQECDIFMAPSVDGMGWGVFAGRPFAKGEVVELAPAYIPMDEDAPAIIHTALNDYAYGYYRFDMAKRQLQPMYAVMLGMGMVYNHHPKANVEYTTFSREPALDVPKTANAIGFAAKRDIVVGEELFSTYGESDGSWFEMRDMLLHSPPSSRIDPSKLASTKEEYCSKIVAGIGQPTWKDRIEPILPPSHHLPFWVNASRLPPMDAELGTAQAKVPISQGERIEVGTALVLPLSLVQGTALGAVAMKWSDLQFDQQQALQRLREQDAFMLQYQGYETSWKRVDSFTSLEQVALLPIGGSFGLIERVEGQGNCRLVLARNTTTPTKETVVVTVEVIATEDISMGERLRLDLPAGGTAKEVSLLQTELKLTGRVPQEIASRSKTSSQEL